MSSTNEPDRIELNRIDFDHKVLYTSITMNTSASLINFFVHVSNMTKGQFRV